MIKTSLAIKQQYSLKKYITLTFFSLCIYLLGYTQSPCDLIRNASQASCEGKKTELIMYLEKFRLLYPTDSLIGQVSLYAAEAYYQIGDFDISKEIANELIHKSVTTPMGRFESCPRTFDSIRCLTIIGRVDDFREIQFNACQILYKISFSKQQFDSALYYLKLADSSFLGEWTGKFHGRLRQATLLKYSEIYEKMGDFDNAINILIPYNPNYFPDQLIALLKKYKGIDLMKSKFMHLNDSIFIEQGIVSENPKVTREYDIKSENVLRTIAIEEYGRITYWYFLGHKFRIGSVNDYKSKRVKGEGTKRKLQPTMSNEELKQESKNYIQTLPIYKAFMN